MARELVRPHHSDRTEIEAVVGDAGRCSDMKDSHTRGAMSVWQSQYTLEQLYMLYICRTVIAIVETTKFFRPFR